MTKNQKLLEEVMDTARAVPIECQKHILDVAKEMALTRWIVMNEKEQKIDEGKETHM